MREEEVVSELLALGLAAVLEGAAKAADAVPVPEDLEEILAERRGVPFFETGPIEWPAPRVIH